MASLCLSSSRIISLRHQKPFLSLKFRPRPSDLSGLGHSTSAVCFNPLRLSADRQRTTTVSTRVEKRRKRGSSVVCYAAPISIHNLQWISTVSCLALILARGTGIHKSVVVPLFALHAPSSIIAWIKGEYGVWAAFLALNARLFFSFPGELELPFIALLITLGDCGAISSYEHKREARRGYPFFSNLLFLAFQHFSRAGSLQKAYGSRHCSYNWCHSCISPFLVITMLLTKGL